MNNQTILNISLVLHLIALSLAMGITIANYVASKQFWKLYDTNKEQGLAAFSSISKFQLFGTIGLLLLIISGITLLYLFQWTFISLLWFKIKLSIVVLIFVNGFTIGRMQTLKLQALLTKEGKSNELQTDTINLRRNLQIFHLTQLSLFILIIVLAVFRFSWR